MTKRDDEVAHASTRALGRAPTSAARRPGKVVEAAFLAGGGEMGAAIRAYDWAATSLGPPPDWPQALRTVLRMMLAARQPVFVFWGPELVCLYNDAYRTTLPADRRSSMLGRPGRDAWPEVWNTLGIEIEGVLAGGAATWHERELVRLVRDGELVDTWWTFGYSPIDDETAPGGVGGVLALTNEVTSEVQSLERLRQMFEQAPGFMAVLRGPEHRFAVANEAYRAVVGGREVAGLTVREAIPEVEGQGYLEMLDRVYRAGETIAAHGAVFDVERPRGGPVVRVRVDFSYQPLRAADGSIEGVFVQGHDVTEQYQATRALREREERLRLAVQAVDLGMFDYDPRTGASWWSERMRAFFGFPADKALEREAFVERVHPDDRAAQAQAFASALDPAGDGRYVTEYRVVVDGAVRWLAVTGQVLFEPIQGDGRGDERVAVRLAGVGRDRTEERHLVEALRDADRRKNEFLAMLAHELRNPLAPIANAVRLLEREPTLTPSGARAVEMIARQARQMRSLVDDLLEVSRITRGTVHLKREPTLLGALVLHAVETMLPAAEAKGQRLRTALPSEAVRMTVDPVRMCQVLENLLGNAVKYTPEAGAIDVELVERDDWVEFRVSDDGIGLAPQDLERIFDLFVQTEPGLGPHQGGLGIGLALARRLVELHGGTVHARSAGLGRGSTFVVQLPRFGAENG